MTGKIRILRKLTDLGYHETKCLKFNSKADYDKKHYAAQIAIKDNPGIILEITIKSKV